MADSPSTDAPGWCACGHGGSTAERAPLVTSLLTLGGPGGATTRGGKRKPFQIFMVRRARAVSRVQHASAIIVARSVSSNDVSSTPGSQVHVTQHCRRRRSRGGVQEQDAAVGARRTVRSSAWQWPACLPRPSCTRGSCVHARRWLRLRSDCWLCARGWPGSHRSTHMFSCTGLWWKMRASL